VGGVSDLFSSPSKQAQSAGQAQQSLAQNEINQGEDYINTANQNTRNAISGLGANPFFGGSGASGTGGSTPAAPTPITSANMTTVSPFGAPAAQNPSVRKVQ
jgi:hypothetical protein